MLAAAIVIASLVTGGRYSVVSVNQYAYVVDRFTGSVTLCFVTGCEDLKKE